MNIFLFSFTDAVIGYLAFVFSGLLLGGILLLLNLILGIYSGRR